MNKDKEKLRAVSLIICSHMQVVGTLNHNIVAYIILSTYI